MVMVDPDGELGIFAIAFVAVLVAINMFTDIPTANAPDVNTEIIQSTPKTEWYADRVKEDVAGGILIGGVGIAVKTVAPIIKPIISELSPKTVSAFGDLKQWARSIGIRGSGSSVRVVENGTTEDAYRMIDEIINQDGVKEVIKENYGGKYYELPDGSGIGIRDASASGSGHTTIDVKVAGESGHTKIKFAGD